MTPAIEHLPRTCVPHSAAQPYTLPQAPGYRWRFAQRAVPSLPHRTSIPRRSTLHTWRSAVFLPFLRSWRIGRSGHACRFSQRWTPTWPLGRCRVPTAYHTYFACTGYHRHCPACQNTERVDSCRQLVRTFLGTFGTHLSTRQPVFPARIAGKQALFQTPSCCTALHWAVPTRHLALPLSPCHSILCSWFHADTLPFPIIYTLVGLFSRLGRRRTGQHSLSACLRTYCLLFGLPARATLPTTATAVPTDTALPTLHLTSALPSTQHLCAARILLPPWAHPAPHTRRRMPLRILRLPSALNYHPTPTHHHAIYLPHFNAPRRRFMPHLPLA